MLPREVHVTTHSRHISAFMETNRDNLICFRCGQAGHMRYQCLTFKVKLCHHNIRGECTDTNCSFAHGEQELRQPWKLRCVRVIRDGDKFICIGCNSCNHTFRKCPIHSDLIIL